MINNEMIEFIEFLEDLGYVYTPDLEHNKRIIIEELKLDYLLSLGGLISIKSSGRVDVLIRDRGSVLRAYEDYEILDISILYPESPSLFVLLSGFEKDERTKITDKFKELKDRVVHKEVDIQW